MLPGAQQGPFYTARRLPPHASACIFWFILYFIVFYLYFLFLHLELGKGFLTLLKGFLRARVLAFVWVHRWYTDRVFVTTHVTTFLHEAIQLYVCGIMMCVSQHDVCACVCTNTSDTFFATKSSVCVCALLHQRECVQYIRVLSPHR